MIDFNAVTIPVQINADFPEINGIYMANRRSTKLLTVKFNITSRKDTVMTQEFAQYISARDCDIEVKKATQSPQSLQQFLTHLHDTHDAWANATFESIEQAPDCPARMMGQSPIRLETDLCILNPYSSHHYIIAPADPKKLAKAFMVSAHTGAMVDIDVAKDGFTSNINLFAPAQPKTGKSAYKFSKG